MMVSGHFNRSVFMGETSQKEEPTQIKHQIGLLQGDIRNSYEGEQFD